MIPVDDDHFEARVDMALSFLFLGWIASMGDGIQIIAPVRGSGEVPAGSDGEASV